MVIEGSERGDQWGEVAGDQDGGGEGEGTGAGAEEVLSFEWWCGSVGFSTSIKFIWTG